MSKRKVLLQLDADRRASSFDAIVAIDAGVDQVLQYHGVEPSEVRALVHGAMFTRGPQDLHCTAIFIGGADVAASEALLRQVTDCFFGPLRVSVMLDANGANTTAAAAVLAAARHVDLDGAEVLVLGATGPVGQRTVRLLAREGARVRAASRDAGRAATVCAAVAEELPRTALTPRQTALPRETAEALAGVQAVIAAGAAGVELVPPELLPRQGALRLAIDLNATPPAGIAGIEPTDKAVQRDGVVCYGAIGVGGAKMRIHKAAVERLFLSNDLVLNAEEAYAIGRELEAKERNQGAAET